MAEASWRAIAIALASRMENHDFCEDHEVIDDGVEEGCPFCLDRATMRTYREKAGVVRRRTIGRAVAAHEIRRTIADEQREFERGDVVKLGRTAQEIHVVRCYSLDGQTICVEQHTTGKVRWVRTARCVLVRRAGALQPASDPEHHAERYTYPADPSGGAQ